MTALTEEDINFMKWLDQPENKQYWVTTKSGEQIIMRDGWDKAFEEYTRIKQLLKECDIGLPHPKYQRQEN